MFGRTTFNGITDTELYRLEQLSVIITERGEAIQQDHTTYSLEHRELAQMITQLGRITTLQTQALRSIR